MRRMAFVGQIEDAMCNHQCSHKSAAALGSGTPQSIDANHIEIVE